MDLKPETFATVRSYIFDYVTGALWLISIGVLTFQWSWIGVAMTAIETAIKTAPSLHIPDFVVAFLLIIGGVVLPYVVSVAVKPLVLRLMNALNRLQRSIQKSTERTQATKSLETLASLRVIQALAWKGSVSREIKTIFLNARAPNLAMNIERTRDEIWFRASAVLPTALLFAGIAYRLPLPVPRLMVVLTGMLMFAAGSWFVNVELRNWYEMLHAAILLLPTEPVAKENISTLMPPDNEQIPS